MYVLDFAAGSEARRVTSSPLAARGPVWSPDGAAIAYQSAVYPGATDTEGNRKLAAERKEAKSKVRRYESFPIRRWDKWLDETRTHVFVVPVDGDAAARDSLAGTRLAAEAGFGGAGSEGSSDDLRPAFAPGGRSLVIVASVNQSSSAYASTNTHLCEVSLAGGEPRALTSGTSTYDSPAFSPDGASLCVRVTEEWGRSYALDRLACAAWPWTGAPSVVGSGFDRSVADFAFAPDSRTLYLTAEDEGFVRLYSAQAPVIVAGWGSATEPVEIVRVDPAAKTRTRLTPLYWEGLLQDVRLYRGVVSREANRDLLGEWANRPGCGCRK